MKMEFLPLLQALLTLLVSGFAGVLWYNYLALRQDVKEAHKRISEEAREKAELIAKLDAKFADHRLHVAETYVTQDSLTKAIDGLNNAIGRLIDTVRVDGEATRTALSELHRRIDGKADKA
jgi:hypothetical protein